MLNISIVIPNFNGEKLLKKNLPRVLAVFKRYKKGKTQVIVSDDASKDNSVEYLVELAKKEETLLVLQNNTGKNKGFSGNVDKGVTVATGEIIILLNTDVVPHEDFLEPLLQPFQDKDVFAVGCMDESVEDGKIVLRGRGVGKWRRGFLMHKAGDLDASNQTLWASCGSGAFRKSMWDTVGGLNNVYNPFYWEDIDLSYKAQKMGYRVLFEKRSIVTHAHEEGAIKKNYSSFNVTKTAYRNQFFFTWLNATDTIIFVQHFFFLPYFLIRSFVKGDRAFLIGFWNALIMLPKVLQERKKIQKLVKKSDREVISLFSREA